MNTIQLSIFSVSIPAAQEVFEVRLSILDASGNFACPCLFTMRAFPSSEEAAKNAQVVAGSLSASGVQVNVKV